MTNKSIKRELQKKYKKLTKVKLIKVAVTYHIIFLKDRSQIQELKKINSEQAITIKKLERSLNLDSNTSSKPPSTDGFKKPKKREPNL